MKVVTVVGARPQFVKAAPLGRALRARGHGEFLLHTGQHYDREMSHLFFEELGLPPPDLNLNVGSGSHARQTAEMLVGIEAALQNEKPDWVLVFGDTNSTLAGALAAVKLGTPVAHVEAGLRSFNRNMPEEHNRVLTDHCADTLFCPTPAAVEQLRREGIVEGVHLVGDPMLDAAHLFGETARDRSAILPTLGIQKDGYLLATLHRSYNTDDPRALTRLFEILGSLDELVILPLHPRTRQKLADFGLWEKVQSPHLRVIEPVGYLDMLMLEQNARLILTDSGGVQKEACFFAVPCLTLRTETEWVETLAGGWNTLVGLDAEKIRHHVREMSRPASPPSPIFGDGHSAEAIVHILEEGCAKRGIISPQVNTNRGA